MAEYGRRGECPRLDRPDLAPRPAAPWWLFWSVGLCPALVVTEPLSHCCDNLEMEGSRISDSLGVSPAPASHCFHVPCDGMSVPRSFLAIQALPPGLTQACIALLFPTSLPVSLGDSHTLRTAPPPYSTACRADGGLLPPLLSPPWQPSIVTFCIR